MRSKIMVMIDEAKNCNRENQFLPRAEPRQGKLWLAVFSTFYYLDINLQFDLQTYLATMFVASTATKLGNRKQRL